MDYDIIKHVLKGDISEFDLLIDKYYNEIFKFVYNQVNNIEISKNLVQEIFMRVYNNIKKYNPNKASFRTWLYRISNNYCINYYRKNKNREILNLNLNNLPANIDIIEDLLLHEDVRLIMKIMKKALSKRNFNILILHFFSELNYTEIGETYNLASKTIKNIVYESIKTIRNIVKEDYDGRF